MNFKQKLGYTCIGCLFTIAGYILASLGGVATHTQKDEQVLDKIVCRELEVVNTKGITVAGIVADESGDGAIEVRNAFEKRGVDINADVGGKGVIEVSNAAGDEVVGISADADGNGEIEVSNAFEKRGVDIFVNEDGGVLIVYNAAGETVAGIVVN